MTALCGGGPSGPQAGVGGVLSIGAAGIEVFIASVLDLPALAPVLAPIVAGLLSIDIAVYCGTDPPADPGLSADDVADAIKLPPSFTTFQSQQKVLRWFEHQYWYNICECTSVTTPTPSAPSNPGSVTTNPGIPGNPASPCWSVTVPYSANAVSGAVSGFTDLTPYALPPGATHSRVLTTGPPAVNGIWVAIPAGATNFTMSTTIDLPIQTAGQFLSTNWQTTDDPLTGSPSSFMFNTFIEPVAPDSPSSGRLTLPSTATWWSVYVQNFDTIRHTGSVSIAFFCPPGSITPQSCCAPDPILEGELQQILQYVQAIYDGLPIQPNSFAEGSVHSGLSGAGSVTFSGVPIALKVTLTTLPGYIGRQLGDPDFFFDVGYLSFGTSEGNYAQTRVELEHQVVSVPLLAGSVGYTLLNGVVASITELLPGP